MTKFDKMLKELSRNVEIPKEYNQKVDEVLNSLPEKEITHRVNKRVIYKRGFVIACCLICLICILKLDTLEANANIFESFRLTIMDILHINQEEDPEEIGVESKKTHEESKPDLMLELQETVIDTHNIYMLIKITAPANIAFDKEIAFDYFGFCEGENYNTNNLIGGATDCYLLETMKDKPNIASYVVSITTDQELEADSRATMFVKDLERNPFSDDPEMLVEGIWSISFSVEQTVKENLVITGTPDMTYPFVDTTASLESIELTPLGITIVSDVSNFPFEDLGISDTTIAVKLKMIDGSELLVMTHDPDDVLMIESGSNEYDQEGGKSYLKNVYAFREMVDINKVVGIYIEDLFVPAQ